MWEVGKSTLLMYSIQPASCKGTDSFKRRPSGHAQFKADLPGFPAFKLSSKVESSRFKKPMTELTQPVEECGKLGKCGCEREGRMTVAPGG